MTSNAIVDHSLDLSVDRPQPISQDSEHFQPTATDCTTVATDDKRQKENVGSSSGNEPIAEHHGRDTGSQQEEVDEFGLPIRVRARPVRSTSESTDNEEEYHDVEEIVSGSGGDGRSDNGGAKVVTEGPESKAPREEGAQSAEKNNDGNGETRPSAAVLEPRTAEPPREIHTGAPVSDEKHAAFNNSLPDHDDGPPPPYTEKPAVENPATSAQSGASQKKRASLKASEWSHQRLNEPKESEDESEAESDCGWQDMPAIDEFDVYDDYGRLVARGAKPEDNDAVYKGLGGAGKGYTRVQLDEDAQSATSLDEDTSYLFKEAAQNSAGVEGEELRDPVSQLQATKDLLTESQRIAYVGVARLAIFQMTRDLDRIPTTKGTRKAKQKSVDSMRKWGQTMMTRIYAHMDIDAAEQVMIEQLAEHGVQPADLVRPLMQNARVQNPLAEEVDTPKKSMSSPTSPGLNEEYRSSLSSEMDKTSRSTSPPPYDTHEGEDLPEVRTPSQLPTSAKIDIDLRWTVLCDLFLVLIADSAYDARSRTLLEKIGNSMEVSWLQIARFEKRVIDALEMQEEADKETWDESDHMEKRRKMALKRKFMVMGLATVGGGLVIGLSAGLLAPVIGAGLAAGFTTVGISGTSAFLGGVGGTALIAGGGTLTGGTIGLRASNRRTGAVQTFEYRPLHNNKRVNLIVTVSGWMTGKVDDVRLPFSTVDPIMGDLYSVLWEPDMLRSMGDTINILATEVGIRAVLFL
jgi:hypothetical protein